MLDDHICLAFAGECILTSAAELGYLLLSRSFGRWSCPHWQSSHWMSKPQTNCWRSCVCWIYHPSYCRHSTGMLDTYFALRMLNVFFDVIAVYTVWRRPTIWYFNVDHWLWSPGYSPSSIPNRTKRDLQCMEGSSRDHLHFWICSHSTSRQMLLVVLQRLSANSWRKTTRMTWPVKRPSSWPSRACWKSSRQEPRILRSASWKDSEKWP